MKKEIPMYLLITVSEKEKRTINSIKESFKNFAFVFFFTDCMIKLINAAM